MQVKQDPEGQEARVLELDNEELAHASLVPEPILYKLNLANEGGRWVLSIVQEASPKHPPGSPTFLVLRSLISCSQSLRAALKVLFLGYHGACLAVLRSAYESLLYSYLFDARPKAAASWLQLALDNKLTRGELIELQQKNLDEAKLAFNERTEEKKLGIEIWESTCDFVHHTAESVAAEANLAVEELYPGLQSALKASNGDFGLAFDILMLQTKFAGSFPRKLSNQSIAWTSGNLGVFDEESLDLWSTIILYLTHRAADLAIEVCPNVQVSVRDAYEGWHGQVKSLDT